MGEISNTETKVWADSPELQKAAEEAVESQKIIAEQLAAKKRREETYSESEHKPKPDIMRPAEK